MQGTYSFSHIHPTPAHGGGIRGATSSTLLGGNAFFTSEIEKNALQNRSRCDLLSFLEAMQQNGVDLLAITWQSALDILGAGATAEVRQALVNLQMSFAFKRPISRYISVDEDTLYKWLIRELTILCHPVVRRHRNLLNLEGVCWDPSVSDRFLRPVLVFKRAEHGDSHKFMTSRAGQSMSLADRMSFAIDVIDAVVALHKTDIIHGDIKPQNVLVFNDEDGTPFPRIADFGYSSLVLQQDGSVALPISKPWNAPEVVHHARTWSLEEAKGADAYSLGLVCLWLLFGDRLASTQGVQPADIFFSEHGIALIQNWKKDSLIAGMVAHMIDTEADMNVRDQSSWRSFFGATFQQDGLKRCGNIITCLGNLQRSRVVDAVSCIDEIVEDPIQDASIGPPREFKVMSVSTADMQLLTGLVQITLHFLQLLLSHYRLRQHIKECLVERVDHDPDIEVRQNAALQLAICYSIGFGCFRDETEAENLLKLSKSSASELSSAICSLRDEQDIVYENKAIAALVRNGNFQSLDYGLEYRQELSLHQVEEEYNREIHDLSAVLGSDHVGVLNLRMILVGIMIGQGRFLEAEQAVRETMDRYTARLGPDHQQTLRCTNVLATILEENDRFDESKSLHQVVLEQRARLLGPNHLDTLESVRQLGIVLQALGEFEEADTMAIRDYEGRLAVLGEKHPDVYESIANVASVAQDMGNFNDSVSWNERALEGRTQVLGREHPQTLTSISNLASVLQEMEEYDKAEPLFLEDLELSRRTLGKEHQDTITALSNLGLLYMDMERYDEAERITREALTVGEKVQGHDHSATLISRSNLAIVLERTERYEEAEVLLREVLHSRERLFEPSNLLIATSNYNLAANYVRQGRLEEAMSLHEKALQIRKTKLGEKHPFTLESMADVAHIMRLWHRFSEAEDLLRTVLRSRVSALGHDHSDTHDSLGELISLLQDQEKEEEAEEELSRFAQEQSVGEESDEEVGH